MKLGSRLKNKNEFQTRPTQRAPEPRQSAPGHVVGVAAFSGSLRGFKLIPSKWRYLVPAVGNASRGVSYYFQFRKVSRNENQTQSCILSDFDFPDRLSIRHSYTYHINHSSSPNFP
jgi:hypothetical protein